MNHINAFATTWTFNVVKIEEITLLLNHIIFCVFQYGITVRADYLPRSLLFVVVFNNFHTIIVLTNIVPNSTRRKYTKLNRHLQTIYFSMIIRESDIKAMVCECVSTLLEYHGSIDSKIEGLANIIIDRVKGGEEKFSLTKDEIEEYYPYKNCPSSLDVIVKKMPLLTPAAYSPTTNTININHTYIPTFHEHGYATEVLMHELTHFVNNMESNGSLLKDVYPEHGGEFNERAAKRIGYLFSTTEMQARVSQFRWTLNHQNGEFKSFEKVTHLKEMLQLIWLVENDELLYTDDPSLVELLLYRRAFHKTSADGKDREVNMSYDDFEKTKEAIVKKMKRAYKEYYQKLAKVYYDNKKATAAV